MNYNITIATAAIQSNVIPLTGTVLNENNEELIGVSVFIKNKNTGTVTDVNGRFNISASVNDSIYFSYFGYKRYGLQVTSEMSGDLEIKMTPFSVEMSELLVVAYGTANKKTYTGSVASINSDDIARNRSNNVLNSLQGVIPGLQLQNRSLGSGRTTQDILIRGASTINASTVPLYIIDGVPGEAFDQLNPEDIESISVLKDAAAISLYGARATNGVILVTTKQGKINKGRASVTYNGQLGFSTRTGKDYAMVGPKDYYELTWEALRNGAQDNAGLLTAGGKNYATPAEYASNELLNVLGYNAYNVSNPVGLDGKLQPGAQLLWWEDYENELIKGGLRQEHNFNINGVSDKLKYYLSIGYLNQKGLEVGNSGFSRFSNRINLSYELSKWITVGANVGITNSRTRSNYVNNGYSDFATYARQTPGLYPLYKRDATGTQVFDENGEPILDFGNGPANILNSRRPDITAEAGVNPLGTLDLDKSGGKGQYLFTNFYADFNLYKGLKFKATYSSNVYNSENRNYRKSYDRFFCCFERAIDRKYQRDQ